MYSVTLVIGKKTGRKKLHQKYLAYSVASRALLREGWFAGSRDDHDKDFVLSCTFSHVNHTASQDPSLVRVVWISLNSNTDL